MGSIQRRKGPNVVGFIGLTQPFADGLKLYTKETIIPTNVDTPVFLLAPAISFTISLICWAVIPFSKDAVLCNTNLGAVFLLAMSSLNVYGVLFAGWSSNTKYAYLGSIRSAAQMISYEISIGMTVLCVSICTGSFNLITIVETQVETWLIFPLLPMFIIFYISMLAETNWHPFDLPEAEAELVSGYNTEYSGITFALFFLSEYANMILMSTFSAILFLGGWLAPFNLFNLIPGAIWLSFKILLGITFFILTRATLPWYRYDQLMYLGWKCFLPLTFSYFILITGILISFNILPE
jgi:NADH-quinone oxidoreductase subunit H